MSDTTWFLNEPDCRFDSFGATAHFKIKDVGGVDAEKTKLINGVKAQIVKAMHERADVQRLFRLRAEQASLKRQATELAAQIAERDGRRQTMLAEANVGLAAKLIDHDVGTEALNVRLHAMNTAVLASEISDIEACLRDTFSGIVSQVVYQARNELLARQKRETDKLADTLSANLTAIAPIAGAINALAAGQLLMLKDVLAAPAALAIFSPEDVDALAG